MQIKRFEANDLNEALQMIKQEFGPNAVILSASKKNDGWMRFFRRTGVIVTAATDMHRPGSDQKRITPPANNGKRIQTHKSENGQETRDTSFTPSFQSPVKPSAYETNEKPSAKPPNGSQCAQILKKRLLAHGMEAVVASELVDRISERMEYNPKMGDHVLRKYLVHAFESAGIRAAPIERGDKNRRIIVMTGPTGVGKTITIAKLAAVHKRAKGEPVSVITLDHDRIGAVDQMRRYAGVIGVSFYSASSKEELRKAVSATSENDLVFVDTPGVSPKNKEKIERLGNILSVLRRRSTHLVIGASTRETDFEIIWRGFEPLAINSLLFTKIDETDTYGPLLNWIYRSKLPVSYLARGQRIPEDLEDAQLDRLAGLILPAGETLLIEGPPLQESPPGRIPVPVDQETYVANRNSDIYHTAVCRCARQINKDNRIEFESREAAVKQNFKPCKHCCAKESKVSPILENRTVSQQKRIAV